MAAAVLGFNRRLNLRTALIVYVLLPMGLLTVAGAWWSLRAFERQVEARMQKDLEMVARAIKQPLNHALLREREGSIAQALESAFAMSHVYGAYLYDSQGRKISEPGSETAGIEQEEVSERAAEGERHGEYGRVAGRDVYSYFVPLTDSGGRIVGLLQLTRRRSDFHEHIRGVRYKAGGLFLIAFISLTGVVLFGYHRVFGKHLNRFSASMTRIAEGERLHRFALAGPREIMNLGEHFNRMLDNIDRVEREIERRRDQQKRLEERLRQTEKLAAVGELAAGVAHELGTPLSLIDGKSQRALRVDNLPQSVDAGLRDIRREVGRMERIIRQLLDFSRRHKLKKRSVKACDLATAAVAAVAHEASELETRITVAATDQGLGLQADAARVEQALVNLLRNAVQAAPGGQVRVAWQSRDGEIRFEVEDDGSGIEPEARAKLFEPFFTTKPVGQGTGLGLAVVHGIAEEHGGGVELAEPSAAGFRTCFRLRLPLVGRAASEAPGSA